VTTKRHSEAVLSDRRDWWWNEDYLELVARRLRLAEHAAVLDVGSGQGHWGQRLLRWCAPGVQLSGVDGEPAWVVHAAARAAELGWAERCSYRVGRAEELPFASGSFSLVTCQTLLMHVSDPRLVLREMLRVLRPGGRLLLAEPSNLASFFVADSVSRALTPAQLAGVCQLVMACSRGRARLGRGDDCIGDALPALLRELGVREIDAFGNDRANFAVPPYDERMRAQLAEELEHVQGGFWLWDRGDARLLFEAGGGEPGRFDEVYASFMERTEILARQVKTQTYTCTGASFHYLITGVVR
jgi:ubiquinone/menaquinone biosynthesis C-methylase UbiE